LLGYQSGILRPHGIRNPPSASTQPVQPGP
jgi:hypothetical protein